ncbi:MAG: MotA/TolQ/ExbB proton channel family protein, partial [Solimonas sp.]
MENSMGLGHFVSQADLLARFILVLMAVSSVASWYLIVTKSIGAARAKKRAQQFLTFFWNAPSIDAVGRELADKAP